MGSLLSPRVQRGREGKKIAGFFLFRHQKRQSRGHHVILGRFFSLEILLAWVSRIERKTRKKVSVFRETEEENKQYLRSQPQKGTERRKKSFPPILSPLFLGGNRLVCISFRPLPPLSSIDFQYTEEPLALQFFSRVRTHSAFPLTHAKKKKIASLSFSLNDFFVFGPCFCSHRGECCVQESGGEKNRREYFDSPNFWIEKATHRTFLPFFW